MLFPPHYQSFPIVHKLLKLLFTYFSHPPQKSITSLPLSLALFLSVSGLNLNKQSSLCSKTVPSPHPKGMLPPILHLTMVTGNLRFYTHRGSKD